MNNNFVNLPVQQRKTVLIWAVLLLSILISWLWVESVALLPGIIALTAVKVWLVVHYYMEVGQAPRWLRLICSAWMMLVFSMILGCYLQPQLLRHFFGEQVML